MAPNSSKIETFSFVDLDWDTRVLGFRTGRITEIDMATISPAACVRFVDEVRKRGFEYVTVRLSSGAWDAIHMLESAGFRLIDGILLFEKKLGPAAVGTRVRLLESSESSKVATIAGAAFRQSRFHNDEVISNASADQLHEEWARNCCKGEAAEAVLVAVDDRDVGGFITCKRVKSAGGLRGVIDLVGVHPASAGKGLGRDLVEGACHWFSENGCSDVHVQTQTDNHAAIRLYTGRGFSPIGTFITLRWTSRKTAAA